MQTLVQYKRDTAENTTGDEESLSLGQNTPKTIVDNEDSCESNSEQDADDSLSQIIDISQLALQTEKSFSPTEPP